MTNFAKKRMPRVIVVAVLAIVLCLGMSTTAFAAGELTGTETAPPNVSYTKVLTLPDGTTVPSATFNFTIAPVSVDGASTPADLATMPALNNASISFASTDTGTVAAGTRTIAKNSADIFNGVTWPHAGVYVYRIEEDANTYTAAPGEAMTYSGAAYTLTVWVENGSINPGVPYVHSVATTVGTPDNSGQTGGTKVNPDPSEPANNGYSAMTFTNAFITQGGGSPLTDEVLGIGKTVAGQFASQTKLFDFVVSTTKPSGAPAATTTYKAYIVENGTTILTSVQLQAQGVAAGDIQTDTFGAYIEVSATGTSKTISIHHNQRIVFTDLFIGSTYTVTEQGDADYTPTASVVTNSGGAQAFSAAQGASLTVPSQTVGNATNTAEFINTIKSITPTGIIIENLPFIMMFLIAIAALALFVVTKAKRRQRYFG